MSAAFPATLILAGGLGTRIRELAGDLPKSMVPINGTPFIDHQLQLLARNGVSQVVLCVGHRSQPLVEHVADGARFSLHVQYSSDGDPLLGTGGAVLKASRLVGEPFAVLYGDSYLDFDFQAAYRAFAGAGKHGLMTVFHNCNQLIPSNVLFEEGVIKAYEKAAPTAAMQHVDFGLSIFARAAFAGKPDGQPFDLAAVLQKLIAEKQLAGFETQQRFYEVGTPQGVHDLEHYLQISGKVKPQAN